MGRPRRAVQRADDAQHWNWLARRLPEIPPLYARSWFSGLNAALRSGALLPDPSATLTAAAWVLEQPADPASQGGPLEDDVDFYGAQLGAADVLIGLLGGDMLAIGERERVWALIQGFISDPDPTRAGRPRGLAQAVLGAEAGG